MKPTDAQIERGLSASYALRDSGDSAKNVKPISFTADPRAHVKVIGEAMLPDFEDPAVIERACLRLLKALYIDKGFDGGWPHTFDAARRWRFRSTMRTMLRETIEQAHG